LGFIGKESVFAALLDVARTSDGDGTGLPAWAGWLAIAGVVVGSMLTVAYTLRFLWGAFATKAGVRTTDVTPVPAGSAASPVVLTVLTVALGFAGHTLTSLFEPHLAAYPEGHHHAELALLHGLGLPLLFSAVAVLVGALLFRHRHS